MGGSEDEENEDIEEETLVWAEKDREDSEVPLVCRTRWGNQWAVEGEKLEPYFSEEEVDSFGEVDLEEDSDDETEWRRQVRRSGMVGGL